MLGIVGGMGPQAGVQLNQYIIDNTPASRDQEHLPTVLWSTPHIIPDRTEFLLGREEVNPALLITHIISNLVRLGVSIIGIPCNTFHATPIWSKMQENIESICPDLTVVNMIQETVSEVIKNHSQSKIGLLSTLGTYQHKIYYSAFLEVGIDLVEPKEKKRVHDAIYNSSYGIKSMSKIGLKAGSILNGVASDLKKNDGVDTIILGCTELSLPWVSPDEALSKHFTVINPLEILGKVLVSTYLESAFRKQSTTTF